MAFTVSTRTSQDTVDGTSHTVTLPDGSDVSGRLVVVVFATDGPTSVSWPGSPAFTEVVEGNGTGTTIAVAYRFIDGTEAFDGVDDTITVTTVASEQTNAHAYLISAGHHASAAPEAAATALGTNNGTTDPPSLTPSWGTEEDLWIAASALRFAGNHTAAPTNYTDLLSLNGGDTNAPLGTARRVLSAVSEDPGTFSHDGGNTAWVATTVAVRPAAGGATVAATPGTLTLSPVTVTPTPGAVTVAATAGALTLTPVAVTATPGPVAVAATPGILTLTPVAATPEPGPVTVAATPGILTLQPVAAGLPGSALTVTPGQLTLIPVAATPTPGPVTIAATTGTLTLQPVAAGTTPGPVTVAATPGALTLVPVAVGAFAGEVVTPTARIYIIPAETRTTVIAETRILAVDAEPRILAITESRTLTIPTETRTLVAT